MIGKQSHAHFVQDSETKFVKSVSEIDSQFPLQVVIIMVETQKSYSVSEGDLNVMLTETREKILKGTIQVFNKKGLKLTMDDVADELKISKKTIYKEFSGKDEIFETMVDYVFDNIKIREKEILNTDGYTTLEKIRLFLSAMPESYRNINFQELYSLKDKYPKVYKKLQKRLETGWEPAFKLLEQGKEEGIIREDADLKIFKIMMEASLERFFEKNVMKGSGKKYNDYLNEVVDILLNGISA